MEDQLRHALQPLQASASVASRGSSKQPSEYQRFPSPRGSSKQPSEYQRFANGSPSGNGFVEPYGGTMHTPKFERPATRRELLAEMREEGPVNGAAQHTDELFVLRPAREVNAISLSPDAKCLVMGLQDHTIQIWDMETQREQLTLRGHKNWVTDVAFSPDGAHVASASADKTARTWNASNGQAVAICHGHLLSVASVAWSPDASKVATGSWDKSLRVWDAETGQYLWEMEGHTDWVHGVAWSPTGQSLASGSSDHSVRVWSSSTGDCEEVLVGHSQTVCSVDFSPDGILLVSGSLDRTVRIWNIYDGSLTARLQLEGDLDSVHVVRYGPGSDHVTAGCRDKSVKVWNFKTNMLEAHFTGHRDAVSGLCVSRKVSQVLSCSADQTIRGWQVGGLPRTLKILAKRSNRQDPSQVTVPKPVRANHAALLSGGDFHDRLRDQEEANMRLRQQINEARMDDRRGQNLQDPSAGHQHIDGSASGSIESDQLKELHDRLRNQEEANMRLRLQINEERMDRRGKNLQDPYAGHLLSFGVPKNNSDRHLLQEFSDMLSSVSKEKDRLARLLEENMQKMERYAEAIPAQGYHLSPGSVAGTSRVHRAPPGSVTSSNKGSVKAVASAEHAKNNIQSDPPDYSASSATGRDGALAGTTIGPTGAALSLPVPGSQPSSTAPPKHPPGPQAKLSRETRPAGNTTPQLRPQDQDQTQSTGAASHPLGQTQLSTEIGKSELQHAPPQATLKVQRSEQAKKEPNNGRGGPDPVFRQGRMPVVSGNVSPRALSPVSMRPVVPFGLQSPMLGSPRAPLPPSMLQGAPPLAGSYLPPSYNAAPPPSPGPPTGAPVGMGVPASPFVMLQQPWNSRSR